MFGNIGKKVKALARIFFVLGLAITVFLAACIVMLTLSPESSQWIHTILPESVFSAISGATAVSGIITAAVVLVSGFIISLILNWILYAIGEAADNKNQIDYLLLVLDDRKAHATSPK